jgi:hypothetical protein
MSLGNLASCNRLAFLLRGSRGAAESVFLRCFGTYAATAAAVSLELIHGADYEKFGCRRGILALFIAASLHKSSHIGAPL